VQTGLASSLVYTFNMLTLFLDDPNAVRLELSAMGPHASGPFRLVIEHATGEDVEYFMDLRRALLRAGELEDLVMTARLITSSDMPWTSDAPWATPDDRNSAMG
jgi:hypothetical protein